MVLTNFMSNYTPKVFKIWKPCDFLMFLGGIERDKWHEMA